MVCRLSGQTSCIILDLDDKPVIRNGGNNAHLLSFCMKHDGSTGYDTYSRYMVVHSTELYADLVGPMDLFDEGERPEAL